MKQIVALVIVLLLVPLTASAQDFCEGNFDYDDDQDGSDAFTFKTDFGRSSFGNPCPPDGPAPVAKTGQTFCANSAGIAVECNLTGQDGEHQRGVEWPNPRFADNGDGTVKDNLTGLIWLRDANCSLFNAPRTWENALNIIVPQLEDGYCGLTDGSDTGDWRLPNYKELFSLVNAAYWNPPVSNTEGTGHWSEGDPFINIQWNYYWSSTSYASMPNGAWYVIFAYGNLGAANKFEEYFVWPVRGGH